MIKALENMPVTRWDGEEIYSANDVRIVVSSTSDYETTSVVLDDGRVLVVMVLDDRGADTPANDTNTNTDIAADAIRDAYNNAKQL